MTPCQGADFRHFPSDTSAVGIWWGLFVFRTIRIWNTNCWSADASNASPPLYSPPFPRTMPPLLPIVLVNICSTSLHRNKESSLLFLKAGESHSFSVTMKHIEKLISVENSSTFSSYSGHIFKAALHYRKQKQKFLVRWASPFVLFIWNELIIWFLFGEVQSSRVSLPPF